MPGENIQDWSVTAANNATADSSIGWAEGMARAGVNDSARSMMAAVAKDRNLKNGSITTGGTANAQTFSSGLSYTTVPTGLVVRLKIGVTNTASATLNMDGIGAVTIKDMRANDLGAGALFLNAYADFLYNGTNWILLDVPYAEGTFTPAFSFGGGTTGITYGTQSGVYTRHGRSVKFTARVTLTNNGSSTGAWLMTGLPFTVNAGTNHPCSLYWSSAGTLSGVLLALCAQGSTTIAMYAYATGAGTVTATDAQTTDTTDLILSGEYIV